MKIPFVKTDLGEEEIQAVSDCIRSGWVVLGQKSEDFEKQFAEYVGAKYAVFVDSCTSALFLAGKYIKEVKGIKKITVPSLTFTASAEAMINAGLKIEFGDVDFGDFTLIEGAKCRLPVNLFGNKAKFTNAPIVDSAHRIEKDDMVGTNNLWCFSFYATKNISTVQGGMIATNDEEAYNWLKKARDHGLNLGTKERYTGKYKQYDIEFVGYRVKGDDFRAVMGIEQLKKLPAMTARRNEIVNKYNEAFGYNRTGNHVYPIMVQDRDKFMDFMIENGVQVAVHYRPLHEMTGYKKLLGETKLPITEFIGQHIVSVPLFPQLTNEEQDYIIQKVNESGQLIK